MIVREMAVNWVGRLLSGIVLLLGASLCDASPTSVIYYHTDALGSVVAVTNEAGEVIERREYEPYGLRIGGDSSDGPGYTGHVHDRETGLDYMQQRYYDPAIGVFLSVDPVAVDARRGALFNRYAYANNNPYKFTDPDGRMFWLAPVIFGAGAILHSEPANAPARGEALVRTSPGEAAAAAIPGARPVKAAISATNAVGKLSQQAANREAKREAGIPTSQQPSSQSNGRASDGTQLGRQQSYEVPKAGGGTETKSVQISRDTRGDHADMPQIEAGAVKPGGQVDPAGRPRIQNVDKIRVDFDPKR